MTTDDANEWDTLRLGDDPITKRDEDRLSRLRFVDQVTDVVLNVGGHRTSCVFSLVSPWGGGKSSVLRLVGDAVAKRGKDTWSVVEFNPWVVSDLDSLLLEFFVTIASAGGVKPEVKSTVRKYAANVLAASKVAKVPLLDVSQIVQAFTDKLGEDTLVEKRDHLAEVLGKEAKPILVVIDDIDRLYADELLMLFKLVRLVGRLPYVHYLLAFDEETVLDVLETQQIAHGDRDRARAYLEKIVQFRFDLPPLHWRQAWNLAADRIDEVSDLFGVAVDPTESERFVRYWQSYMSRGLATPRAVNRWATQIQSVWPLVKDETNFVDVAAMTYLPRIRDRCVRPFASPKGGAHRPPPTGGR